MSALFRLQPGRGALLCQVGAPVAPEGDMTRASRVSLFMQAMGGSALE